jgi:hypothetical protein
MDLPYHEYLPVHLLSGCFNKTSATYKFYWFLALLGKVEMGEVRIRKNTLFAEMVANAWYTVNYFKLSFGKQDQLQTAIVRLRELEDLTIDADQRTISKRLSETTNRLTDRELTYFNSEVPHRFLSPWFRVSDMRTAYSSSQRFENKCLYSLEKDYITINPVWVNYLQHNSKILKNFCCWNLAIYLQAKNPNVPDIPNKIIKSTVRKNLNAQRRFWDIVIGELGTVDCIYTNKKLVINDYAVEHFLPYAFVSHDLMWNLIPADRSFNSFKSDRIPSLEQYFDSFFKLQRSALEIIQFKAPKHKFLEDYLTVVPDLVSFTKERMFEQFKPLATIAQNNGFELMR